MLFFNESASDIVQLISLPLEVFGFCLTFIEVKTPGIAEALEAHLDALQESKRMIEYGTEEESWKRDDIVEDDSVITRSAFKIMRSLVNVSTIPLAIVLLPAYVYWVVFIIKIESISGAFFFFLGLSFIGIFCSQIAPIIFISLISKIIKSLNKLTGGKAIGAIGLILAALGVIGEIYQVLTMFFGA